ncbi:MAG: hypothetical protein FIA91_11050 [Geobacter sp.]|nr:hypothetical protein [Geobacter sp.]
MFGWFGKKDERLEFADNRAAFEYACANLPNRILLEAVIPALVEEEGRRGRDGERTFLVTLAAGNGGRQLWTCTLAEAVDWPVVGDFVGFRVVTIAEDLADEPTPIGYIAAVLAPLLVGGKYWKIARNLTPDNIKQTFRY